MKMLQKKSLILWSLVIALVFLFGLDSLTAAQTRGRSRRRSRTAKPVPTPAANAQGLAAENAVADDTPAQRRTKLNEAILKNCKSLEQTIKTANVSLAKEPFDRNQPDAAFVTQCSADGTLSWTAQRVAPNDPVTTAYNHLIVVKTPQLDISQVSSENGVVKLVSESPTISVQGIADVQLEWWIDLRHEKYANKFTEGLRELFSNLAEKEKLPPA